jgi:hypothetical protein
MLYGRILHMGRRLNLLICAITPLAIALAAFALNSCNQDKAPTSSTPRVLPFSKLHKAPPPTKPTITKTEFAGEDDTRYFVNYQNTEFQIVGGEKGLFGMKVIAPDKSMPWDSIWLDFFPQRSRPRTHTVDELSGGDPSQNYVSEDIRKYVLLARDLALKAAPQEPQVGDAAVNPRGSRLKISGLDLPAKAANELAIMARSDRSFVVVNMKFPVKPLSSKRQNPGFLQLDGALSQLGYTPDASWARLHASVKLYEMGVLMLKRGGRITCYLDFYKRRDKYEDLEAVISVANGRINLQRYGLVKPGEEKTIPLEFRQDAGMVQAIIDNQFYDPPKEFKDALVTALLLINAREKADTFAQLAEPKGGIEDILSNLGTSQN